MSYGKAKDESEDLVVVIGQESRHFLIPENDPEKRKERKGQNVNYRFVPVSQYTTAYDSNSFLVL